jgi:hypothetical protein
MQVPFKTGVTVYIVAAPKLYLDVCGDELKTVEAGGVSVGLNMRHTHSCCV